MVSQRPDGPTRSSGSLPASNAALVALAAVALATGLGIGWLLFRGGSGPAEDAATAAALAPLTATPAET